MPMSILAILSKASSPPLAPFSMCHHAIGVVTTLSLIRLLHKNDADIYESVSVLGQTIPIIIIIIILLCPRRSHQASSKYIQLAVHTTRSGSARHGSNSSCLDGYAVWELVSCALSHTVPICLCLLVNKNARAPKAVLVNTSCKRQREALPLRCACAA